MNKADKFLIVTNETPLGLRQIQLFVDKGLMVTFTVFCWENAWLAVMSDKRF